MKGKSLFALLLVCSLALLPAAPAMATPIAASTYYVATTGNNANDGSLGAPWLTIQYAVDTVRAGDTIRVAAGTYTEQVTIQKSVNLIGAGRATTIIQAPSAPRTAKVVNFSRTWDYVVGAYATSGTIAVFIEGFTIDANGQDQSSGTTHFTGVFFRDVNGAGAGLYSSAIQNFGTGAVNYGMQIFGDSNLTVGYNTLTGYTRDGIDAWGNLGSAADPNVTISYNDLVGTPLQALNGIMLTDEATGTVSWNSVQDHTRNADWAATGVLLWGSDNVNVSHNTLTNCFNAIDLYLSDGSTIHGNLLEQTIKRGINLDTSNGNTVDENIIEGTLTGTEDVGIALVWNSNGNTIHGNAIALPPGGTGNLYAIHVQGDVGAGSNTISNNTIDGGKRSIPVDTGTSGTHTISGNIIGATTAPSWSGIELQSGNAFITGNTLINAVRPIEMWGPHDVTISGNTFEGFAYNAINAGSYTGTIRVSDGNKFINISGPSLWNQGAAEIDATNNWWGDPSGPWHATDNPQGLGGSVVGNVDFGPWYIDASMTILSDELHLTVSVAGLGTVTKNPDPDLNEHYSYGDVVTLTPAPATGWKFDSWSGAVVSNPLPITGNTNIGATFTQIPYTLTVNVTGSGTVAKNPNRATYVYGDVVTLTPTPAAGWQFDSWSGAVVANQVTIADVTIVGATFTQIPYTLTVNIIGSGTVAKNPDRATYVYGDVVILTPAPATGWKFDHWTGSLTGSANPASLTFDGNETVTAVFDASPPPPPPPGDLGPFEEESEDGVVVIDVPAGISENPVFLTIGDAENPPPTDGNPNLGAYDVELKDAKTGEAITELTKSITITFRYTAAMLAAAGVTDPHDLVIWYWDEDAEPAACWVALPTVVDEVAGTISATVDHLTTFIAMVDEDFPKLGDIAGHWAETDILRLASYGAVNGFDDGTFRPETGVTRAQFAKFIVATLGITPGTALPVGFKDASDAQDWAVPYLAACLRDGIMTGADGLLRPNATITRAEAAAMVVRALGLAAGGSGAGTGGGGAPAITFADAASIPAWAATLVAEAVDHGLIEGLPGSIFSPAGTLTRAQAVTILSRAADLE